MPEFLIRNETPADFAAVENLTREAFWNVNVPGCNEHYLAHILRSHPDFIPELDLVAELDGQIIGNVMYTKSSLAGGKGTKKEVLTFGPVSIHPDYQRRRYGARLLEHSFVLAAEMGYEAVVIFGNPENYVGRGFVSCRKCSVSLPGGVTPTALLVKELVPGALAGENWIFQESGAYEFDPAEAEKFESTFPPKEKAHRPSQELFYILSRSKIG